MTTGPGPGRPRKEVNRKDKMLHTRIPDDLDQHLKDRAERMGLSVSSIVRTVLVNTFDMVEGVVSESAAIAGLLDNRDKTAVPEEQSPGTPRRYGWQKLTLDVNAICIECNDILPRGSAGALGIPAGDRPEFLCLRCLNALSPEGMAGTSGEEGNNGVSDEKP